MDDVSSRLLEQINLWINFTTVQSHEQLHFCRSVKTLLPQIFTTVRDQTEKTAELHRSLSSVKAQAEEYKVRAESQQKVADQLSEELRKAHAEVMRLKKRANEAVICLSAS